MWLPLLKNQKQTHMKHYVLKLALPLIAVLVLAGCKKNDEVEATQPPGALETKIANWLQGEKLKASVEKSQKIEDLGKLLNYGKLYTEPHYDGHTFVMVPIKPGYKSFNNKGKNPLNNLMITLDKNGTITEGKVMQFVPDAGAAPEKLPENTFHNLCNSSDGEVPVNGRFTATTVGDRFLYSLDYRDGDLKGSIMFKQPEWKAVGRTNTCTDWYLVTTYYENGVIVSQTTEYLGQTCSTPYNPNMEDQDAGDVGGGPGDYQPIPKTKSVSWVVGSSAAAGWHVKSYETLVGSINNPPPNVQQFSNIAHQSDAIFNTASPSGNLYTTWQKLAYGSSVTPGGAAGHVQIAGKVANIALGEYEISNVHTWLAAGEF
jgi:hypothetical protein